MLVGSSSPRGVCKISLCFMHYPHSLQRAQRSLAESQDLQRQAERRVGPLPPRLNAGFLGCLDCRV